MGQLDPRLAQDLLDLVGLTDPTPTEPLHVRLVATLQRLQGHNVGAKITALRFDFNWELNAAGKELGTAKTNYEHYMDREMFRLMNGEGYSAAKAKVAAGSTDEAFQLQLIFRLAEQRERSMRNFLKTLDGAMELHRTDRADQRAADFHHSETGV
jgi:hypothetical protein